MSSHVSSKEDSPSALRVPEARQRERGYRKRKRSSESQRGEKVTRETSGSIRSHVIAYHTQETDVSPNSTLTTNAALCSKRKAREAERRENEPKVLPNLHFPGPLPPSLPPSHPLAVFTKGKDGRPLLLCPLHAAETDREPSERNGSRLRFVDLLLSFSPPRVRLSFRLSFSPSPLRLHWCNASAVYAHTVNVRRWRRCFGSLAALVVSVRRSSSPLLSSFISVLLSLSFSSSLSFC